MTVGSGQEKGAGLYAQVSGTADADATQAVRPLRLLWLAPYNPWPTDHGGKIRVWAFVSLLASRGARIRAVYASTPGDADDQPPPLPNVEWRPFPLRQRTGLRRKVASMVSRYPEAIWETQSNEIREEIRRLAPDFDAVVLDQAHMSGYAHCVPKGVPLILVAHNIEHELTRQIGHSFPKLKTRLRYRLEAAKFRRIEKATFKRAALVVTVSAQDKSRIHQLVDVDDERVVVRPNGVDLETLRHHPQALRRLPPTGDDRDTGISTQPRRRALDPQGDPASDTGTGTRRLDPAGRRSVSRGLRSDFTTRAPASRWWATLTTSARSWRPPTSS